MLWCVFAVLELSVLLFYYDCDCGGVQRVYMHFFDTHPAVIVKHECVREDEALSCALVHNDGYASRARWVAASTRGCGVTHLQKWPTREKVL